MEEQRVLLRMLLRSRVTTITGHAGIGKSTLAAHTMARLARSGQGRLIVAQWWQPGRTDGVREGLCEAVGLPADAPVAELCAALGRERTLLLVDDVDPCRRAVARLLQQLLMSQPQVRVLATSRAPLGLGEERILRLGPLGSAEGPLLYRSRVPGNWHAEDEAGLASLCATLDNNPLAIVLATEPDLAGLPKRHTSMYRAEGAGARLLEEDERTVWARLAVLPASFDMATAHAVAAYTSSTTKLNVDAAVVRLHQHSVLVSGEDPGAVRPPRFRLTPSARVWGLRHLHERGEHGEALRRMKLQAQIIAAEARKLWHQGHQRQALDKVEENWPLLEAEATSLTTDREAQLGICVDLWFWWATRGQAATGLSLLRQHLPHVEPASLARCEALTLAAHLALACGSEMSHSLLSESWDAAVAEGALSLFSAALTVQAYHAAAQKDWDQAHQLLRTADVLTGNSGADWTAGPSIGQGWSYLAAELALSGQLAPAAYAAERAECTTDTNRDAWAHTHLLYAQAIRHHRHGRAAAAWRACHVALEAVRHHHFTDLHGALHTLAESLEQTMPRLKGLLPSPHYPRDLEHPAP
ncbi:NACHT domain-containing protein [Streptomyces sp. A0642]|uniref:NACHT domain-containing protein n=1 Tax=Streptomyces sp. A0642 TaxID=2563100 RepID=UPI001446A204|nr:NACHT domain-containing protein [Streptomyces sp. A0642]